jgi:anaerobic selenocysteine-containing dehydrogenase
VSGLSLQHRAPRSRRVSFLRSKGGPLKGNGDCSRVTHKPIETARGKDMSESDNGARKSAAYPFSSGGWGSLKAVASALTREKVPLRKSAVLLKENKPDGFACVSCSWAKPADPHVFEFCESGAKATAWDLTAKRMTPQFFELHTVTQLSAWHDHDLEEAGRITAPLRYDAGTDKYVSVGWEEAFEDIGRELRALNPKRVVFYASGRASLETSYMYQVFVCTARTIFPTARTCALKARASV